MKSGKCAGCRRFNHTVILSGDPGSRCEPVFQSKNAVYVCAAVSLQGILTMLCVNPSHRKWQYIRARDPSTPQSDSRSESDSCAQDNRSKKLNSQELSAIMN